MPQIASITFRDQSTGRINDLLVDEGMVCAQSQNLLSHLAGALLNYKDEGIEFSPPVVLCGSIVSFLKAFPGSISHSIGTAPLDPSSAPLILKDCAPLTNRNWSIFIERTDATTVAYGVFTYFKLPTAIPLHEGITIDPNQFCVLVRKIAANTIEMRGARGSVLKLIFSTVRDAVVAEAPIALFCDACCSDISDPKLQAGFRTYFGRIIEELVSASHGTMLICGRDVDLGAVPEMQDSVPVVPLLDFRAAFAEYQTSNTAGSILNLQRCEELLQGFLRCDGIVLFDTSGRVSAYRVFYRPVATTPPIPAVVGGARRRAFEGVKLLVGHHLVSALFRSQDGLTIHQGVDE